MIVCVEQHRNEADCAECLAGGRGWRRREEADWTEGVRGAIRGDRREDRWKR